MQGSLEPLLRLLDLEPLDELTLVGSASLEPHVRAFGGQIAAQTLVAACRTVDPQRLAHSLHSYFLRPGSPEMSTTFRVTRVRDGRSFSTRFVEAEQDGQVIFQLSASFHLIEKGLEHSDAMPKVTQPDLLQPFEERFAGRNEQTDMARWFVRARPFDIRYVQATPFEPPQPGHPAKQQVWFKTADQLPDDPSLHLSIAAYASDMTVLDAVLLTHGMQWTDRKMLGASLDHAMWFHQPFRADEWLLFDQESPIAHGGRGLARAQVWTQDGRLAISIVQEALLRPPGERK